MRIFKFNRSICIFAKRNFREFIMCVFGGPTHVCVCVCVCACLCVCVCVCVCLCVHEVSMKCHYVVVFKKTWISSIMVFNASR